MKLINFRIKGYKSIEDSGICWTASDITILAGKNESGKTAILESLRDFDPKIDNIPDSAMALNPSPNSVLSLELCFSVEPKILKKIEDEIELELSKDIKNYLIQNGLTIIRQESGYFFDDVFETELNAKRNLKIDAAYKKIIQILDHKELEEIEYPETLLEDSNIFFQESKKIAQTVKTISASHTGPDMRTLFSELSASILKITEEAEKYDPYDDFIVAILKYIPKIIFFSSFESRLPFEIESKDAASNSSIMDFAKVAGLDIDQLIKTADTQKRKILIKNHSAKIAGNFKDYWKQDDIELAADVDGTKLLIGINEKNNKTILFKPEQRSKGFQWFLSFYLKLQAEKAEKSIILIDEPGLYLHAKAQKDVLDILKDISKTSQIIFTTHSPYLIDTDRLDRIRLIVKNTKSEIIGKIHKGVDNETLTPIITAIGLDISNQFTVAKDHNILLEGISDYYYIQALKRILEPEDWKGFFIPCVGAQKIPTLVSLLLGWGLQFRVLLDFDSEGKKIYKILKDELMVEDSLIDYISDVDGNSIEDLFSRDDFKTYILLNENAEMPNDIPNSKFLKSEKLDKVLIAKKFFDKVNENIDQINLSELTRINFSSVFKKISWKQTEAQPV